MDDVSPFELLDLFPPPLLPLAGNMTMVENARIISQELDRQAWSLVEKTASLSQQSLVSAPTVSDFVALIFL